MASRSILAQAARAAFLAAALVVAAATASSAATDFRARVTWEPSWGSIGYRIYVKPGAADWDAGTDVGMPPLQGDGTMAWTVVWTLAGVPIGGDVAFRVTGYDAAGVESNPSNVITVDEASILAAVTPVDLSLDATRWVRVAGTGTFATESVAPVDDLPAEALRLATDRVPSTLFGVGTPTTASLGSDRSQVSFSFAAPTGGSFMMRAVVQDTRGRHRKVAWVSGAGIAYVERNVPTFPVGDGLATGAVASFTRDLSADVRIGLGSDFELLDQVQVFGALDLRRVRLQLDGAGGFASDPPGTSAEAPTTGWRSNTKTNVVQGLDDPDLGRETIEATLVAGQAAPRIQYPAKGSVKMIAPFKQLKIPTRGFEEFSVEVQLLLEDGTRYRMTFATAIDDATRTVTRSQAKLPMPTPVDVPGSPWDALVLRCATEFAALQQNPATQGIVPTSAYAGMQRLTLRGGFWIGPVAFEERVR